MRNLRRAEAYEPIFKRFTESPHPISGRPIFATQREFLCFLGVLGFSTGARAPVDGKTLELDGRVFETNEQSRDVVYLVALAGTREADILLPEREDEAVSIFEEYVAAGFQEIDRWLKECPDDHVGDQAILTALRRDNYFGEAPPSLSQVLDDVEF
jgi:dnd system-associated protein 4